MDPFLPRDLENLRRLGISPAKALSDLQAFRRGQRFADLARACSPGDGILPFEPPDREALLPEYAKAASEGRAMQFVPASGAATRMFKALQSIQQRPDRPDLATLARESLEGGETATEFLAWFQGLDALPFSGELRAAVAARGQDLERLAEAGDYRPIVAAMLEKPGLGYADMPKALIPFHAGPRGPRTALAEHLAEAVDLVRDRDGVCRLHFTVAPGMRPRFAAAMELALAEFG